MLKDSRRSFQRAKAEATAAESIKTRTPVAYAPPCASTLALKMRVTITLTMNSKSTSGRELATQEGAIPKRGK